MCVSKKDVKKSMKLFHKYQKKEKKAWKEYKKMHYSKDNKPAKYFSKFGVTEIEKLKLSKEDKMLLKEGGNCPGVAIRAMRKRLMGWFHLLHGQDADARKAADMEGEDKIKDFHKHVSTATMTKTLDGSECQCTKSTMWQFNQLDKDSSNGLSVSELSYLLDNSAEPCVRPAVEACDKDMDGTVTDVEWCCCFSRMVAPCFNELAKIQKSSIEKDQYIPRCDKEGYYMREQCSSSEGGYRCWCVDYNGNRQEGSEAQGRAHCTKKALMELKKKAESKPEAN